MAGVGNHDFDRRRDRRSARWRCTICLTSESLQGLGGVVDQVGDGPLDGFGIGLHRGQIGGQKALHLDAVQPPIEHQQRLVHDAD